MGDLVTWLRAQLDEDERIATNAEDGDAARRWHRRSSEVNWDGCVLDGNGDVVIYDEGSPTPAEAEHIARHDPARVLAEVDAKRLVLTMYDVSTERQLPAEGWELMKLTARCIATAYADRPGYREEWRPE